MRWINMLTAALLGLTTLAYAREPVRQLPPGAQIAFSGDSLESLAQTAGPQVRDGEWFVWTAKDSKGHRTFTIAQAVPIIGEKGKTQWVILDHVRLDTEEDPLERTTLPLDDKRPRNDGLTSYAVMAARDNQRGTLYEIGVAYGPVGSGNYETEYRHFVLHDPKHGWRYVGRCEGKAHGKGGWADGFSNDATTFVEWTDDQAAPVRVVVARDLFHWHRTIPPQPKNEGDFDETNLTYFEQAMLSGCLPCEPAEFGCRTTTAEAGDTLDSIARRLSVFSHTSKIPLIVQALAALNPTARQLAAGQKLYVPSHDEDLALANGAIMPAQLPLTPRCDLVTLRAPTREEAVCAAMVTDHTYFASDKVDWPATLQLLKSDKEGQFIDLNGDGKLDWIGNVDKYKPVGQDATDIGGQNADWAIIVAEPSGYRVVGSGYGSWQSVLGAKHDGWADIEVFSHPGGMPSPHWTMRFDGKRYR